MRSREQLLLKLDLWQKANIEISHTLDSGIYIAVWHELKMFGYGDKKEAALNDLLNCLLEYYGALEGKENSSLGVVCVRDKEILNKFLKY